MSSVSLIVPVYNGERFLRPLLDSVISQTHQDWHCLCVNDGSTDSSPAILAEYAAKDKRFSVVTQQNGGCGTARNTAMNLVETPYLTFADQDDVLHPQAFEIAVKAIEASQVDCLCFGFSRFLDKPDFHPVSSAVSSSRAQRRGTSLITGKDDSWPIFVWRHIFKTKSVKGLPFPPVSGGEDQAWMSELSWNNLSWASIPTVLYGNRERPDSQSRGISARYIDCVFASYDWIRHRAAKYDIDSKWLRRYIRHMAIMYTLSVIYRSPKKFFYVSRKLRLCLTNES